jgi:hypothetical protein
MPTRSPAKQFPGRSRADPTIAESARNKTDVWPRYNATMSLQLSVNDFKQRLQSHAGAVLGLSSRKPHALARAVILTIIAFAELQPSCQDLDRRSARAVNWVRSRSFQRSLILTASLLRQRAAPLSGIVASCRLR